MYFFFSLVFGIAWAVISFLLLFKVWDGLGPVVLNLTKNHMMQMGVMVLVYLLIFGIPAWIWVSLFG